jgi:ABC-2 type transport system permease protein
MNSQQQWVAFSTIVRREIRRFMRIWPQTLVPPVITMALYFVIFGKLVGSRIGDMSSLPYIQFVAPGLIMMSVITNSYSNVVSSFFGSKFQSNIEELLVSPTPNWIILVGYVVGGMARGLGVGLIVTILSLYFADFTLNSLPVTIGIVLMTSLMFSLAKKLTSAQLLGHTHLAGAICCPATGHKTEIRAICYCNSFILVLEGDDDLYRPKNFNLG